MNLLLNIYHIIATDYLFLIMIISHFIIALNAAALAVGEDSIKNSKNIPILATILFSLPCGKCLT